MTLRFSVYGGSDELDAYRAVAATYHRRHPRVTIHVEAAADGAAAGRDLERVEQAGTPPDVFLADAGGLARLIADDDLHPVDELLERRGVQFGADYDRLGLEAFAADSHLQCMPSNVSPYVVFYNTRLLGRTALATAPDGPLRPVLGWPWATFVQAARQMSTGEVKGLALEPQLTTLTALLRSAGTDVVDNAQKPSTLKLADGGTRSALVQVLEVARNPRLTPTQAQLQQESALHRFEQGRLAMIIGTRSLVPTLRQQPDLRFDVAPLPVLKVPTTVADVEGYCISRRSRHTEAAADFITFAAGVTGSKILARSGGVVPANLTALHSPSFAQPGRLPTSSAVFSRVVPQAGTMPDPPAWPRVVSATRPLLQRLFYAPVLDLDTLLPRIDETSAALLQPSPSPSPSS